VRFRDDGSNGGVPTENKQTLFDFAAEVGLTKHFGGLEGTEELAELCHIDEGTYVLDVGACAQPLTTDAWARLLENAGLQSISVRVHPVVAGKEARLLLRRYGCRGMIRVALRGLRMYIRNPAYRKFVKGVREGGVVPQNLDEYFGYGMYVGGKE
jgi:hypothetical protein